MMIVAIVQARMMSTRLPGKVLRTISGKPMLVHIIDRVGVSHLIGKTVVATTTESEDTAIVRVAQECGVDVYRGSVNDLVDRFYQAVRKFRADAIVRITADCPLIDPVVVDRVIKYYLDGKQFDYVSNTHPPTYPDGLDIEVFSTRVLERMWREVKDPFGRGWVTANFFEHPEKYRLGNVEHNEDLSYMRWTVDYQDDLDFVTEVYKRLYQENKVFLMEDILNLLKKNPELMAINGGHIRDEAYFEALKTRGGQR